MTKPLVRRDLTLRAASGALSAAETTSGLEIKGFLTASVDLNVTTITTPDGDDEIDFYIQTRIGGTWMDVANVHFANANNGQTARRIIKIGPLATGVASITPTDGTLADNTSVNLPLGDALRIKVLLTGATAPTYAYSAKVSFFESN